MSGRLGNYLELVGEARKKRLEITRSQEKELRGLYEEIAKELENSLKRYSPKTLTYRWLKDYSKTLRRESKTLHQTIEKKVSSSLLQTAGAVAEAEQKFYAKACPILSERFSHVFSSIPEQIAEELMSGGIYRDFSGLSERIWQYEKQFSRDIQTIISRGILAQKSAYDLAKDLETYLRPEAKKPWDWGNVYPGVSRQVDYSAQRLARTAVTHAYQLSLERATKDNPFVEGYRWHSSNAGRVCPLCKERDGQLYEKDSLPLDHPNGMCVVTAEISKSYEEIGRELGDWAAGKNQNPALDRWIGHATIDTEDPSSLFNFKTKEFTWEEDAQATNPNFDTKDPKWTQNCQRCVSAYEARRRGYDVVAKPRIFDGSDRLPYMNDPDGWPSVYENYELISCSSNSGKNTGLKVSAKMTEWGDGSRAIVRVRWQKKFGGGGHVFIAEQENGKTRFLDPQAGILDVTRYFDFVAKDGTYVMRIDNLNFTDKIKDCCESRGK